MPPFDPAFALNFMLPFAEAAYDVANKQTPLMPPGYVIKSLIMADPQKTAHVMATIPLPHQRMVRAMVANNPIMGFVGRNDATQTVIVSFRGTETPEDWLKDLDSLAVLFPDIPASGLVHQGFNAVYQTIRDSVIAAVDVAKVNATSMWVTGHSLGGAHRPARPRSGKLPRRTPCRRSCLSSTRSPGRAWVTRHSRTFSTPPCPCVTAQPGQPLGHRAPVATAARVHSCGAGIDIDGGFTLDLAQAHSLLDFLQARLAEAVMKGFCNPLSACIETAM